MLVAVDKSSEQDRYDDCLHGTYWGPRLTAKLIHEITGTFWSGRNSHPLFLEAVMPGHNHPCLQWVHSLGSICGLLFQNLLSV